MEVGITSALAQLGAVGLLIAFLWWQLKTNNKQCADERDAAAAAILKERERNEALYEKVIAIAEASAKSGVEQATATRELTSVLRTIRP